MGGVARCIAVHKEVWYGVFRSTGRCGQVYCGTHGGVVRWVAVHRRCGQTGNGHLAYPHTCGGH